MVCRINGPSGDGYDKELYLKAQDMLKERGSKAPTSADIKKAMDSLKVQDNDKKPIKGFEIEHTGETFVDFDEPQMSPAIITRQVSYQDREGGEVGNLVSYFGQEEGELTALPHQIGPDGGIINSPNQNNPMPKLTDEQLERLKKLFDEMKKLLEENAQANNPSELSKEDIEKLIEKLKLRQDISNSITTMALYEEGGDAGITTKSIGEEGGGQYTTQALGEEGGDAGTTTKSIGEEGGGQYTTQALGEEGGDFGITTKSIGEEGGVYVPPRASFDLDEIIKELREKYPELFTKNLNEAQVRAILERFKPEVTQHKLF